MHIAIIDGGVDHDHRDLRGCKVNGVCIAETESGFVYSNDYFDDTGHGTAIASIIHEAVPDVNITAIKLRTDQGLITESLILEGLSWCLQNGGIRIVNISLGLRQGSPELERLCKKMAEEGMLIIAAAHNIPYIRAFPADYQEVLGVSSFIQGTTTDYRYSCDGPVNILAYGRLQRLAWKDNSYFYAAGNSYACAHFGVVVLNFFKKYPQASPQLFREWLTANSDDRLKPLRYNNFNTGFNPKLPLPEIEDLLNYIQYTISGLKLAFYPTSEPMVSKLIDQSNDFNLSFEGSKVAIGSRFEDRIGGRILDRNGFFFEDELNNFDLLILDNYLDHGNDLKVIWGDHLAWHALEQGKQIFALNQLIFDRAYSMLSNTSKGKVINLESLVLYQQIVEEVNSTQTDIPTVALVSHVKLYKLISLQKKIKSALNSVSNIKCYHLGTSRYSVLANANFVIDLDEHCEKAFDHAFLRKLVLNLKDGAKRVLGSSLVVTEVKRDLANTPASLSTIFLLGYEPTWIIYYLQNMDHLDLILVSLASLQNQLNSSEIIILLEKNLTQMMYDENLKKISERYQILSIDEKGRIDGLTKLIVSKS